MANISNTSEWIELEALILIKISCGMVLPRTTCVKTGFLIDVVVAGKNVKISTLILFDK
ncbi:MAG: hypothetical protein P8Y28_14930 [Gammaproteobacteria bacterium]|jgi:hypothetical protein